MNCLWCQKPEIRNLTMKEILLPMSIKERRCYECEKKLVRIQKPCCALCMKQGVKSPCDDCQRWKRLYPEYAFQHHCFFQYNEAFHDWVYQYKFLSDYRLRKTFHHEIKAFFKQYPEAIVCSIPLSKVRQKDRGFNQSAAILQAARIPTVELLVKKQHTQAQAQKNRQERLAMLQPFEATALAGNIRGKEVILFDDIYTTGRTLFYAAEILNAFKPLKIHTLSLAR